MQSAVPLATEVGGGVCGADSGSQQPHSDTAESHRVSVGGQ